MNNYSTLEPRTSIQVTCDFHQSGFFKGLSPLNLSKTFLVLLPRIAVKAQLQPWGTLKKGKQPPL
ncbi:hypothetical protein EBQ74_12870 [bacterium]|nr:hypothetical protein [bacterium]